jgi:predicted transcriptional regulator
MLSRLLQKLNQGNKTMHELATELNISLDTLKERFKMLERLGYVNKIQDCSNNQLESGNLHKYQKFDSTDDYKCTHCVFGTTCGETGSESKNAITGYLLTDKGKRILKNQY